LLGPLSGSARAEHVPGHPSVAQIKAAIANGVTWLVSQQSLDGSWPSYSGVQVGVTALACKKLEHHAVDPKWGLGLSSPFDPTYVYKENVERCLEWLQTQKKTQEIGEQPAGNPDTDGDGNGAYYHNSVLYEDAIALMALCEAVETDGSTLRYEQDVVDLADYLFWAQNENDPAPPVWAAQRQGGWGYGSNYSYSDNSVSGWASLALGFYEAAPPVGCGKTIPQWVKDELAIWLSNIQHTNGCKGYYHPDDWHNILKAGNALQEFALIGVGPDDPRVQGALSCMCTYWNDPSQDPGWRGWDGGTAGYQATFAAMKGFTSQGIHVVEACDLDWQADFETELLAEQNGDGSWPITYWDFYTDRILSTTWALLTLQKVAPVPEIPVPLDIKPQSCPNPIDCKDKGVVPAAILGTAHPAAGDVTNIDPASILLFVVDGGPTVAPLRWSLEDVATPFGVPPYSGKEACEDCTTAGPDGFLDLTLKFDATAVVGLLGGEADKSCVVMKLTGKLKEEFGGTKIVGEDVVRFQCKSK
ncbi:MAG TPA: hypothetical protein VJP78_05570, partial [Thermoleophilia bacterium]|nr:hypothetical protein [Thermoleophilia bacterium]